ncbi:MAG TPA: immunity 26/phosphotriesterase HocA family protein [Candidatus Limnocylindrales bacterium]
MPRKGKPGDIVRIDLGDGRHTYGQLVTDPYVAVYDLPTTQEVTEMAEVVARPILFIVAVFDSAIGRRGWPVVGQAPPGSPIVTVPDSFLQDVFLNCKIVDVQGNTRPASPQECAGLERYAVWDPADLTERLRDHYAGRPNAVLENMKLRLP